MDSPSLLVVDDDREFLQLLTRGLRPDFDVLATTTASEALDILGRGPRAALVDVRLDDEASDDRGGLVLLERIRERAGGLPVVMMTAFGDVEVAVESMRLGADDFIQKDRISMPEYRKVVQLAIRRRELERRVVGLENDLARLETWRLVGESPALDTVKKGIHVAARDALVSVMLEGRTGTGKELVARSIHSASRRREAPFVAVSIAALNPAIVESELFGHEKGAFTGASGLRLGHFERANGGTLFLDEIGELSGESQVKLLRFVEERSFSRVGGTEVTSVDVQLVCATNVDLESAVAQGRFREDLFYRLATLRIRLPRLSERREDIPALAQHFLSHLQRQGRTRARRVSADANDALVRYDWPGNVRELRAAIERAVIFAAAEDETGEIGVEHLPHEVRFAIPKPQVNIGQSELPVDICLELFRLELSYIETALAKAGGRKNDAWHDLSYPNRHAMLRRVKRALAEYPQLATEFAMIAKLYDAVVRTT